MKKLRDQCPNVALNGSQCIRAKGHRGDCQVTPPRMTREEFRLFAKHHITPGVSMMSSPLIRQLYATDRIAAGLLQNVWTAEDILSEYLQNHPWVRKKS